MKTLLPRLILRESRWLISLVLVGLFWVPWAAKGDTNLYVLNLTGKGTLKDVFDSGLRPKRWDSSLVSECLVEDKLIRFVISNSQPVTLYATLCRFKVNQDGSLRSVAAESPYLTLEQARGWMLPIVEGFGKSREELDAFLQRVGSGDRELEQATRLSQGSSSFGVGTPSPAAQSDQPFMGVALSWRWNREFPTQVLLHIEWERPYAEMRSPRVPPAAPPGYEQFPIVTEPYVAESLRKKEDHLPAWLESSAGAESRPLSKPTGGAAAPELTPQSEPSPAGEAAPTGTRRSNVRVWSAVASIVLVLVIGFLYKKGNRKTDR